MKQITAYSVEDLYGIMDSTLNKQTKYKQEYLIELFKLLKSVILLIDNPV